MHSYKPVGVCSREMRFDIIDGKIENLHIEGGCQGNLTGIIKLVEGMDAKEVIKKLKGIPCQGDTSCPDQLAKALELALRETK
ncbi:MAG: TIGR03905 family TSCPD domain-containing protein [Clostridiaceae bacterium]